MGGFFGILEGTAVTGNPCCLGIRRIRCIHYMAKFSLKLLDCGIPDSVCKCIPTGRGPHGGEVTCNILNSLVWGIHPPSKHQLIVGGLICPNSFILLLLIIIIVIKWCCLCEVILPLLSVIHGGVYAL